jgi:hypothetical protein
VVKATRKKLAGRSAAPPLVPPLPPEREEFWREMKRRHDMLEAQEEALWRIMLGERPSGGGKGSS